MIQKVFNRYEKKYLLDQKTYQKVSGRRRCAKRNRSDLSGSGLLFYPLWDPTKALYRL